eukprot:1045571-Rhodomonas_salina.5
MMCLDTLHIIMRHSRPRATQTQADECDAVAFAIKDTHTHTRHRTDHAHTRGVALHRFMSCYVEIALAAAWSGVTRRRSARSALAPRCNSTFT